MPRPACQTPATLSQEFAFPLAMLSFVICVFHENMRCIRSYIVSLSIYVCVYRNVVKYFVGVARAIINRAREAAENREQVGEARERERERVRLTDNGESRENSVVPWPVANAVAVSWKQ